MGELTVYDRTDRNDILKRIGDVDIVFTNKTPLTRDIIDGCKALKFIGGLLMEICSHIGMHKQAVHEGKWESNKDWCFWDYPLIELAGKTMGIIGFGRIGQATGRIARALGMYVVAYDAYPNEAGEKTSTYIEEEELLRISDVIVLHCPLLPETEGMTNKEMIGKMKDEVILINNSRGPLIVDADLAEALNSGKVCRAGLDVVSTEPIRGENPLLQAKNCIITPHISWASRESRMGLMQIASDNLKCFLEGRSVHVVN